MLKTFHCCLSAIVIGTVLFTGTTIRADIAPEPLSGGKNLAVKGKEKTSVAKIAERR